MPLKITAQSSDTEKHEYDVSTIIFKNNKLYSGSDEGKLKMWSPDLKLEKEIQAHPCSVYSLTADNSNLIYSCSNDGTVKSWKADTLEEVATIEQQDDKEMWKVFWADDILFVADDKGVVSLYKKGLKHSFIEMMEQIKDIAFMDNLLYSVRDLDLVVTEIVPGDKRVFMTKGTFRGRAPLCLAGKKLCYSSREGRDVIINANKVGDFKEIAEIKNAHDLVINALAGDESFVYSGGWDKQVKQWQFVPEGAQATGACDVGQCVNTLCVGGPKIVYAAGGNGMIWRLDSN